MIENLDKLVLELCKLPKETHWVEFKHNNCEPTMIGADISALANSATVKDRSYAYMIWGVDDATHEIIGTTVNLALEKKGNQELENWLRSLLSKNADFEHGHILIDGKNVDVLIIHRAVHSPVTFQKQEYIRIGSYTKKLNEYTAIQAQLWDKLRNNCFEDAVAKQDITAADILRLLDVGKYFDLLSIPQPTEITNALHYLIEDGLIVKLDNGLYAVTNLGAILFAKKISDFSRLGRKALRVVKYEGKNKYKINKEEIASSGYALCFEDTVNLVSAILPSTENVNSARKDISETFPMPAIREAIANAIIHQDFYVTGAGPVIEIFENRVEVTNPGTPLVDVNRIIDNPPRSRNEKLASLMRRLDMCEELGRGWDRMVISCELNHSPAPRIKIYEESTKVSVFSHLEYANIPVEDRLWSLYLHACVMFVQGETLTNSSLRERFDLPTTGAGTISRLIKQAIESKLIKPVDPGTAPKHMKYVPIWA